MDILFLLIPLSLTLVVLIAAAFWWSLRSDQYEDLEGPAWRILQDDDSVPESDDTPEQSSDRTLSP